MKCRINVFFLDLVFFLEESGNLTKNAEHDRQAYLTIKTNFQVQVLKRDGQPPDLTTEKVKITVTLYIKKNGTDWYSFLQKYFKREKKFTKSFGYSVYRTYRRDCRFTCKRGICLC